MEACLVCPWVCQADQACLVMCVIKAQPVAFTRGRMAPVCSQQWLRFVRWRRRHLWLMARVVFQWLG